MTRNTRLVFLFTAIATLALWSMPVSLASAAEVGPDQGLVVFHRADVMGGKAIRFNIEQNGIPIGQLLAGTTIELLLAPGSYVFSVRAPSLDGQDFITINVEAGRTYTVEGEILWGWPTGRPKFGPMSESGAAPPARPSTASAGAPTDALAGVALGSVVSEPAAGPATVNNQTRPTAADRGRIGLRNFIGDWNIDMWSMAKDGSKLEGKGIAEGTAEGANATRIIIKEFHAAAFPAATGGGQILLSYEPDRGFLLVSNFRYSEEVVRFTGQYQADSGKYVFYLFTGSAGHIAGGIARSSVRVEVRSLDTTSWVADTFASVDGQTIQVQSYRFTRQ